MVPKVNIRGYTIQETEATALLIRLQLYPELFEHCLRVANFAVEIARDMGLPNQIQEEVRITGLFHDVGKVVIPQEVFLKKELTSEEWELIKSHSQQGADLMEGSKFLRNFSKFILYHHERLDGSGYPEGLMKEKIPLISQIIAVADSFDAMISYRPYRNQSFSITQSIYDLKNLSDNKYDPRIIETLERISQKNLTRLLMCLF
jgi:putative nucleotidyltransferase with HDIG domain